MIMKDICFIIAAFCFACNPKLKEADVFFQSSDLSPDSFADSIFRSNYTDVLAAMNLRPLRSIESESVRLVVSPSFGNPYCIEIRKSAVITITYAAMRKGQGPNIEPVGINMEYCIDNSEQISSVDKLFRMVNHFDFYPGFATQEDFVAADGTGYLLESLRKDGYRAVVGWNGGRYKGKDELLAIVEFIECISPRNVLRQIESVDPAQSQKISILECE